MNYKFKDKRETLLMDVFKLFFNQNDSSYNFIMIVIYIAVTLAALAICIMISHKLNVYRPKNHETNINTINTES